MMRLGGEARSAPSQGDGELSGKLEYAKTYSYIHCVLGVSSVESAESRRLSWK